MIQLCLRHIRDDALFFTFVEVIVNWYIPIAFERTGNLICNLLKILT
jgi:hypothetical protein